MSPPIRKRRRAQPQPHEVSVKADTFDRLRAYCRAHGVQLRTVVDDLIKRALDAEERNS